ncbi:MAG: HYExAFE family protein [Pirellulales bacterium]|nr:HYExAFE family protein [Pirellulales bacterium]
MANRDNHYEAAFEEYLRVLEVPYVAVDEAKRSLLSGGSLKSLDFIVSPEAGSGSWLVDVKGRKFPSGEQQMYWKNWSTRDDLRSLARWQELFGSGFESVLVFAYDVVGDRSPLAEEMLFEYRDRLYGFVAIRLAHYAAHAALISPKWDTVAMPTVRFRELAVPMDSLLRRDLASVQVVGR